MSHWFFNEMRSALASVGWWVPVVFANGLGALKLLRHDLSAFAFRCVMRSYWSQWELMTCLKSSLCLRILLNCDLWVFLELPQVPLSENNLDTWSPSSVGNQWDWRTQTDSCGPEFPWKVQPVSLAQDCTVNPWLWPAEKTGSSAGINLSQWSLFTGLPNSHWFLAHIPVSPSPKLLTYYASHLYKENELYLPGCDK